MCLIRRHCEHKGARRRDAGHEGGGGGGLGVETPTKCTPHPCTQEDNCWQFGSTESLRGPPQPEVQHRPLPCVAAALGQVGVVLAVAQGKVGDVLPLVGSHPSPAPACLRSQVYRARSPMTRWLAAVSRTQLATECVPPIHRPFPIAPRARARWPGLDVGAGAGVHIATEHQWCWGGGGGTQPQGGGGALRSLSMVWGATCGARVGAAVGWAKVQAPRGHAATIIVAAFAIAHAPIHATNLLARLMHCHAAFRRPAGESI